MSSNTKRKAGHVLADALAIHGVEIVFCVPGESYIAVLDGLHDHPEIRTIVCRHEGGASMMAEAWGKMTGTPGICFVTRGPGATNGSAGLHVAMQDSTPLIMFVGQVQRSAQDREAFQEIDYRRMFNSVVKWVGQIDDARRIPEFVARAFAVATAGRPGPVVLALPEDMLEEVVEAADARRYRRVETEPGPEVMAEFRERLAAAKAPLLLLGGGAWSAEAVAGIERFATACELPVATVFRRQDRIDNAHPGYAGDCGVLMNPDLKRLIDTSDLLVILGSRMNELATGKYTLLDIPCPRQEIIHIHADAEELGRVYQPQLPINATPMGFIRALASIAPVDGSAWRARTEAAHASYLRWQEPVVSPGGVQMSAIMKWLRERLPDNAVVTNAAGNYANWVHRFHRFRRFGTQLTPAAGSMGYGIPAAIAAKLRDPARPVICVTGDGDFMMTANELATAVQYDAPIVVILLNNAMYGTIRMFQERFYPGRVFATDLVNPDFVAMVKAFGGHAERVRETAEFAPAFEQCLGAGSLALIEVMIDPEALTPLQSLSEIRAAALGGPA
jgi:acetolactate synthase I/II/III large subunit